jgi:hypothetical protein
MPREALQPMSNMIEQALDYWDSKRAGRHMPARRNIDPTEMSHLLPHVVLIDVQREPLDFRYRLVGTAVAFRLGHDYTGERFSALPQQAHGTPVWKTAVRILEEKRPIVSHIAYVGTNRWVSNYRDLSMPLSEDDRTVNMIFSVIQFENG